MASERDEAARAAWRAAAAALETADLLFLDETSTHTVLTRRRARAPRGERAIGAAPPNHGPKVSRLAPLSPTGIGPSVAIEGAVARPVFETYPVFETDIAQFLVPTVRPGPVVILDNLSVHKGERIRHLIEQAGCQRQDVLAAGGGADLRPWVDAIGDALATITPPDGRGFIAHCGFPLSDQQL